MNQLLDAPKIGQRLVMTSKVISIKLIEQDDYRKQTNSPSEHYRISLLVRLANGYYFYTPVRITKTVFAGRPNGGNAYVQVIYHGEDKSWFKILPAHNWYDKEYDCIHAEQALIPLINVGQSITIQATIQKHRRLNRVVRINLDNQLA
jgi:hypothetical protein